MNHGRESSFIGPYETARGVYKMASYKHFGKNYWVHTDGDVLLWYFGPYHQVFKSSDLQLDAMLLEFCFSLQCKNGVSSGTHKIRESKWSQTQNFVALRKKIKRPKT